MTNKENSTLTNHIETVDLKDILLTRHWLYDFLGKSFYMEPSLNEFQKINSDVFKELKDEEDNEGSGISILLDFFKELPDLTEEDINKLRAEYNKLFIGPGHVEAPPWESVYLSSERIIFDEHTLAVREFYKSWNITIKNINKDPDDHIGFQLEFMSMLTSKSIKALENNNIEYFKKTILGQKEFLEKHTLLWIDKFIDNILKSSNKSFYKGLGLFTLEYINMDKELLEDIVNNFDPLKDN